MTKNERLIEARRYLKAWLDAELKVSNGQSYQMGSRKLTMPDLPYISERVRYWQRQISAIEGGGGRCRTFHVIPVDK